MLSGHNKILEFTRFAIVGVIATVLHYGIYLIFKDTVGRNPAYTIGYIVSFIVNYLLSARFTFRKRRSFKNGIGFCCAHLFNYLLQTGLLNLFVWLGVNEALAPVPVYCVAVPVNFMVVRFVFNKAN